MTVKDFAYVQYLLLKSFLGHDAKNLMQDFSRYVENNMRREAQNHQISHIDPRILDIWEKIQSYSAKSVLSKVGREYTPEEFLADLQRSSFYSHLVSKK